MIIKYEMLSGGVSRLILVLIIVMILNYISDRFIGFMSGRNKGIIIKMIDVVFRIVLRNIIIRI